MESHYVETRSSFLFCLRAVQMLARRQVRVFLKMLRPQRLADRVLLTEPFAQVNEFAAMRAEWPIGTGEPVALLFARGTFNFWQRVHGCAQHLSSALC